MEEQAESRKVISLVCMTKLYQVYSKKHIKLVDSKHRNQKSTGKPLSYFVMNILPSLSDLLFRVK